MGQRDLLVTQHLSQPTGKHCFGRSRVASAATAGGFVQVPLWEVSNQGQRSYSALSFGNRLKLRGTEATKTALRHPEEQSLDHEMTSAFTRRRPMNSARTAQAN